MRAGDANGAAASLAEFKDIFGAENVFLEITHHPRVEVLEALMKKIIALARQSGTPLVAQHDVYYLKPDDREATEIMRRIGHGGRGKNEDEDFSFISEKTAEKFLQIRQRLLIIREKSLIAATCLSNSESGLSQ